MLTIRLRLLAASRNSSALRYLRPLWRRAWWGPIPKRERRPCPRGHSQSARRRLWGRPARTDAAPYANRPGWRALRPTRCEPHADQLALAAVGPAQPAADVRR